MKTTNFSFGVGRMTDSDLVALFDACASEMARREEERKTRRSKWVRDYHSAFMRHPNATHKILGKTVVVSVYDRCTGIHMGATTPTGNDSFELSTGIAVAFAKAMGERIPEYI
jgi:hypothetical protein